MILRFSQRFPESAKAQITAVTERLAALWGFADYEVHFDLRCPKDTLAECYVIAESRRAEVHLRKNRLAPDILERDLYHELLHIPLWELSSAFDSLVVLVPSAQRRGAKKIATAECEHWHEVMSELWRKALVCPSPS